MLGDLAQATGPWTYADWDEVRSHLPDAAPQHHDELTLGYRAPGRVLEFASRLLPVAAPGVQPTSSIRAGRTDPTVRRVRENELAAAALEEAAALAAHHALVAVVVPEDLVPEVTRLARRDTHVGVLERDAMTRPVTIVPAPAAKGLEFDAVVVVEPAAIAGDDHTRTPAALRRPDPSDSAPERRARPATPRLPPRLSRARSPTIGCMALDVDGKVALITGGSNGIGEGVARHLAGLGAHVVIADIDGARGRAVAEELDGRFIQTDVTDPAASNGRRCAGRRSLRRPPHRPPQRRSHLLVRHG